MDSAQGMASTVNISAFKEPRGVMRVLQLVFSICAFATTCGFSNYVKFNYTYAQQPCSTTLYFSYPFRLDYVTGNGTCTNGTGTAAATDVFHLIGNFSSDAQFFVAAGVLSFLYCILISLVYLMWDSKYQSNDRMPQADFIITVILAVFWLSGSAAWAVGLSLLKSATTAEVLNLVTACHNKFTCTSFAVGSFSSLDISVIFGFLNFFLWTSDLWFLYKETTWFKVKQTASNMAATT